MDTIDTTEVARFLAAGDFRGQGRLTGLPTMSADGNIVAIRMAPAPATTRRTKKGSNNEPADFLAIIVDGPEPPIVLQPPSEMGISWNDGGDLLALTSSGIHLYPRGADELELDPDDALEFAAHLVAMAQARKAAQAIAGRPA